MTIDLQELDFLEEEVELPSEQERQARFAPPPQGKYIAIPAPAVLQSPEKARMQPYGDLPGLYLTQDKEKRPYPVFIIESSLQELIKSDPPLSGEALERFNLGDRRASDFIRFPRNPDAKAISYARLADLIDAIGVPIESKLPFQQFIEALVDVLKLGNPVGLAGRWEWYSALQKKTLKIGMKNAQKRKESGLYNPVKEFDGEAITAKFAVVRYFTLKETNVVKDEE